MKTATGTGGRTIVTGLRRPKWICSLVKQIVILIRDGSPSMQGKKAKDAQAATGNLVEELALPQNKNGFICAVVDFSATADVIHAVHIVHCCQDIGADYVLDEGEISALLTIAKYDWGQVLRNSCHKSGDNSRIL